MVNETDTYFLQLILSLQMGTMQHLGKTVSPISGKVERNLEMAKHTIAMLEMIHQKTSNNLSEDEQKMLEGVLYELRLNYVDESKKEAEGKDSASAPPTGGKTSAPPADNQSKEPS